MANQVTNLFTVIHVSTLTNFCLADDPKEVIVEAARRLDQKQARRGCFGIQFAQIGDDPDATEALRELDDDLTHTYGVRVCHNFT